VAVVQQAAHLPDPLFDPGGVARLAVDEQLVALRPDLHIEQRFDVPKILVVRAKERADARFGHRNPTRRDGADADISFSISNLSF
jgi:hypothetical protein